MLTRTFFARAPLAPGRFAPLPVGAVSAQGAMRDRLLALRGGLLSRCASLFPEAGEQSAWFGGALGGGMHAPELLEAMLLTSAQLGDEELRREALRLCGRVVERQREDGSFGAPGETFAARGRMLRALCAAYSMSGDKQFLTFMRRYMKYLHDTLRVCALSAEDAMHTADTLEAGVLLYNVTGQKAILSVLMMLVSQGADYTSLFHAFPYRTPISRSFTAQELLDKASQKAEAQRKEMMLAAKETMLRERAELDKEIRDRRNELQRTDRRLVQREDALDKKTEAIESRERALDDKQKNVARLESEAQALHDKQQGELERISSMTSEEARDIIMNRVQKEAYHDAAVMVREIESHAKEEADKKARNIVSLAIQKCAADHVAETTVSVVALPNDDMKGRIIGREGRNIRTLETATGVDLIIDDTPEAVIISGFDSVRREVARIALEKLIMDGRIHPARIEEMVEKAKKEVENSIREAGEQAVFETNLHGIHHELVKLLGRMKYRTSYGQNVLKHSIEVSHLAGVMAAELGADVQLAKRAGLLHDIGKAVDHEIEGTHVTIGADLAKKYHESPAVVHCIMAHHNDVDPESVEAVLVQAADAISAARPGARRESLENYIKRLEKLEEIANSFEGVDKTYAIQSGREVRIIVKPEDVDDAGTLMLARDIVKRIEREMEYPGQIKVNVIRETRAVDFAK